MGQQIIIQLREWRQRNGLTMQAAGERIVVAGRPVDRSTWHAWEHGRRTPSAPFMAELRRVTGISSDAFFPIANDDATAPLPQSA